MNYDFTFGCVFFVILIQNIFLYNDALHKQLVIDELRGREFKNWKETYAMKKQVEMLEHKLSSKS